MNTVSIKGDLKEVEVYEENGKRRASVNKDHVIIEDGTNTLFLRSDGYRFIEVVMELARQLRLEAGIDDE